jgi:hypothetical protein
MSNRTFYVTHYIPDGYPRKGLRACEFLTTTNLSGARRYHMGLDTGRDFSEEDIKLDLHHRAIVGIQKPVEIRTNEGVWVDEGRSVWIADYDNPLADKNRRKVSFKRLCPETINP